MIALQALGERAAEIKERDVKIADFESRPEALAGC
jgi:hypothetical protein